jgi:L-ribulose-5-phosphate 4-epimerase
MNKNITYDVNVKLVNSGLVIDSFGNASTRTKKSSILIKPSGVVLSDITYKEISEVDFSGELKSGLKPSSDTPTHIELYKHFDNIGGIIHTHSTYATAWAQSKKSIPGFGTTHADYWQESIPITRDLTKEEIEKDYEKNTGIVIIEKIKELDVDPLNCPGILVSSHGPFCWGSTAIEALKNAIRLEYIAKMAYITCSINPKIGTINKSLHDKHFLRKHGSKAYYGQDSD